MNVENLRKLRAAIAKSETYNQMEIFHGCGTPACLAGHAILLMHGHDISEYFREWGGLALMSAEAWLGLTPRQSAEMFTPHPLGDRTVTKEDALDMLDRAISTGKVLWTMSY